MKKFSLFFVMLFTLVATPDFLSATTFTNQDANSIKRSEFINFYEKAGISKNQAEKVYAKYQQTGTLDSMTLTGDYTVTEHELLNGSYKVYEFVDGSVAVADFADHGCTSDSVHTTCTSSILSGTNFFTTARHKIDYTINRNAPDKINRIYGKEVVSLPNTEGYTLIRSETNYFGIPNAVESGSTRANSRWNYDYTWNNYILGTHTVYADLSFSVGSDKVSYELLDDSTKASTELENN